MTARCLYSSERQYRHRQNHRNPFDAFGEGQQGAGWRFDNGRNPVAEIASFTVLKDRCFFDSLMYRISN